MASIEANAIREENSEQILAKLDEAIKTLNGVVNGDSAKAINEANKNVVDLTSKYNAAVIKEDYAALYATDNTMLEAIRKGEHILCNVKMSCNKDGVVTAKGDDKSQIINIRDLELKCPHKGIISHNAQWIYHIEALCRHLSFKLAKEIDAGNKMLPNYKISKDAEKIDIPSNTKMVKELQSITDEIIFMPDEKGNNTIKITSYDVRFIESLMHKEGKGMTEIKTVGTKVMLRLLTKALHRNITEKKYSVVYKVAKETVAA